MKLASKHVLENIPGIQVPVFLLDKISNDVKHLGSANMTITIGEGSLKPESVKISVIGCPVNGQSLCCVISNSSLEKLVGGDVYNFEYGALLVLKDTRKIVVSKLGYDERWNL